jgi:hypothetical protein
MDRQIGNRYKSIDELVAAGTLNAGYKTWGGYYHEALAKEFGNPKLVVAALGWKEKGRTRLEGQRSRKSITAHHDAPTNPANVLGMATPQRVPAPKALRNAPKSETQRLARQSQDLSLDD